MPQEEGIEAVCKAYDSYDKEDPPTPTQYLTRALKRILQENSFQFNGKNFLQIHGTGHGH